MDPIEQARLHDAQDGAFQLGHRLLVVPVAGAGDATHKALAGRSTREVATARFLSYGASSALAAELGLGVLKGIVERGEPWPRDRSD